MGDTVSAADYVGASNRVLTPIPDQLNTGGGAGVALPAGSNVIGKVGVDLTEAEYETVAAGQTDLILGTTGAIGDYLSGVLIVPLTTAAGAVSIKDGSGAAITIFAGGAVTPLGSLVPFFVPVGAKCLAAGWKITTGANVSAIGVGNFT